MERVKRIWYLSPMRAAKVQASLRIRAVSPEPSLLAHTSSESRGTFWQKARSLAPLIGWACAVKILSWRNARRHKFAWRGSYVRVLWPSSVTILHGIHFSHNCTLRIQVICIFIPIVVCSLKCRALFYVCSFEYPMLSAEVHLIFQAGTDE